MSDSVLPPKRASHNAFRVSEKQAAEICARYVAGETAQEIANDFGIGKPPILRILRNNGINIRTASVYKRNRFPIKDEAFSIPSRERNYWVGFLTGDCHVGKPETRESNRVQFAVSEVDKTHIEEYQKFVGAINHPIRVTHHRNSIINGRHINSKPMLSLTFNSESISSDLALLGVTYPKSSRFVHDSLLFDFDFWRGIIDAEGTIGTYGKYNQLTLKFLGYLPIISQYKKFCSRIVPTSIATIYQDARLQHSNLYQIKITDHNARIMIKALYGNGGTMLQRKAKIALQQMI